jgi:hypothetical protein
LGRKFTLQKKSRAVFNQQKQGSLVTKREQQRVISSIISDLAQLKDLPESLERITVAHVKKLVDFWRHQGLATATIGNKLAVLRRFNQLAQFNLEIPNNQDLNSIKAAATPLKIILPEDYEKTIFHPITRSVIDLQWHFGLTKLEAMRLNPNCAQIDGFLLIERTIAHNRQDRMIPVITKNQADRLHERENLAKKNALLTRQDAPALISKLYTAECHYAGISPKTPFRQRYAQTRLEALKQTQDEKSALLILCKEMGFSAPRKLVGLL